jgi:RHS repeat-associated protein
LNTADYAWSNTSGSTWAATQKYNESGITYDRNGNIKTLARYHGDNTKIDSLTYANYTGNQLGRVDDGASGNSISVGFQDKSDGSGYDYHYDTNGNLTSDYNKGISSITYNYLNLPSMVTVTGKGTITYTYDAAGNKLQRTILDQTVSPNKTTNYYYAGDYLYRNDTLEFINHLDGRIRPVRIDTTQPISMANLKYIYDYYLTDHLGSIRSVLTTEQQTDLYAATMETAAASKEDSLFNNVSSTAAAPPSGMTNDSHNQMASKLNGQIDVSPNKRVGPSIILKVMTGDTISISTLGWYHGAVQPAASGVGVTDIINDLLPILEGGVAGAGGTHNGTIPYAIYHPPLNTDMRYFLDSTRHYDNTKPKAFLNWMVVDEEFAGVNSTYHTGAIQMPVCNSGDTLKPLIGPTNMIIRRNGWIYIYLSNESAQDVFFDNLVVNLRHGPLVEQKDYYAFGMEVPGLGVEAIKKPYNQNRYGYNGIEYDSALGLDYDEAKFRDYDPQIARFSQIDPKVENAEPWSVYSAMLNNPVLNSDPLGDSSIVGDFLDKHGWGFREPTTEQWHDHPIRSLVGEAGYLGASLFGLVAAEHTARTLPDNEASPTDKALAVINLGLSTTRGEGEEGAGGGQGDIKPGETNSESTIPDEANVVRGGLNTPQQLQAGTGTHPSGVTGVSAECGTCSVDELSKSLPNNQIRVTSVGKIRKAGGEVVKTSGRSPNHVTVTGLTPTRFSELLDPPIPNPSKKR